MSKKTEAIASLKSAAKEAGGAHLTVEARMRTAARLGESLYAQGFKFQGVDTIAGRHIVSYMAERKEEGASLRTMQNEMSHIRGLLSACGRDGLAGDAKLSNATLGIDGACRNGSKVAATDEQYREAVAVAARHSPSSVAAALQLERTLGLRCGEAIRSGASLKSWERQLQAGGTVEVIFGTKGGRERTAVVPDREAAIAAVRHARGVSEDNNGHLFAGSLKQASAEYRNNMYVHVEIQGHALRYAYAMDLVDLFRSQGFSEKEVFAKVALSLGHGDGRGRYVRQVYARRA